MLLSIGNNFGLAHILIATPMPHRMRICSVLLLALISLGCQPAQTSSAPSSSEQAQATARASQSEQPTQLNLYGLTLGMTEEQVLGVFPTLVCNDHEGIRRCEGQIRNESRITVELGDRGLVFAQIQGRAITSANALRDKWGMGQLAKDKKQHARLMIWSDSQGAELVFRESITDSLLRLARSGHQREAWARELREVRSLIEPYLSGSTEGLLLGGARPGIPVQRLPRSCERVRAWDWRCYIQLPSDGNRQRPGVIVTAKDGVVDVVSLRSTPLMLGAWRASTLAEAVRQTLADRGVHAKIEDEVIVVVDEDAVEFRFVEELSELRMIRRAVALPPL